MQSIGKRGMSCSNAPGGRAGLAGRAAFSARMAPRRYKRQPALAAALAAALAGLVCLSAAGCMGAGRVEQAGAEVLDLVARQTAAALDEYERDMQAVDAGRRQAVVQSLAERVKRDGPQQVDAHAAAAFEALEKIAADRQTARQRYEAAMDNVELLREVAGGLRRYSERLQVMQQAAGQLQAVFQTPPAASAQ
jgi:hypothetical protein